MFVNIWCSKLTSELSENYSLTHINNLNYVFMQILKKLIIWF